MVELEGPSMLGCAGVYYKCPLVLGPDKVLPKKEMQQCIRDFLYQQLNTDDRGLTACLIIHTLTKDSEKVILVFWEAKGNKVNFLFKLGMEITFSCVTHFNGSF